MTAGTSANAPIPQADELSAAYVRLALALEQHVPGYTDSYFGPAVWKTEAEQAGKRDVVELSSAARELAEAIAAYSGDAQRKRFLAKQVVAMQTTLRILSGEPVPFVDEVQSLYDITPNRVDDAALDMARRELESLIPGEGTLDERIRARRQHFEVGPDTALGLFQHTLAETRRRTSAFITLPHGEDVDMKFVSGQPWSAYNWYLGRYRSLIEINTDSPFQANRVLDLIAHEGYPGHHTEHSIKEAANYEQRGWLEGCVVLINAPECVVSEGIATSATDAIFADGEAETWQRAELYPRAGLTDPLTVEQVHAMESALNTLGAVSGNAAFMLHVDGRPADEVVAYIQRYSSRTLAEAERSVRFLTHPLYRSYTFTYSVGRKLFTSLFEWFDKAEVFRRVLSEALTPSDLMAWRASGSMG